MPKFQWPAEHAKILNAALAELEAASPSEAKSIKEKAIRKLETSLPETDPKTKEKFGSFAYLKVLSRPLKAELAPLNRAFRKQKTTSTTTTKIVALALRNRPRC